MVESDKLRFKVAISAMAEVFRADCPASIQATYWMLFSDWTVEQFENACHVAMLNLKWFPKPVELRELVGMNIEAQAAAAFDLAVLRGLTNRRPLDFSDKLINATIRRLGGLDVWSATGDIELYKWERPKFIEAYKQLAQSDLLPPQIAPLRCSLNHKSENTTMLKKIGMDAETKPLLIECDYIERQPAITYESPTGAIVESLAGSLTVNQGQNP